MNEYELYNMLATLAGTMVGLLIVISCLDEDDRRNKR